MILLHILKQQCEKHPTKLHWLHLLVNKTLIDWVQLSWSLEKQCDLLDLG